MFNQLGYCQFLLSSPFNCVYVNPKTEQFWTKECKVRWKIEGFHREIKPLTGIERCQGRKGKSRENHIGYAMRVWARLKNLACQTGRNVYDLWKSRFDDMISRLFQSPIVTFA